MAQIRAVPNGNWSSTATWLNGVRPTTVDDVHPSGFVVTIDENIEVLSLRTTAPSGGVVGGSFLVASSVTVNLTGASPILVGGTGFVVRFVEGCSGASLTTQSSIVPSAQSNGWAIATEHSAGSVTITTPAIAGPASTLRGTLYINSTGLCTLVTPSVTGGASTVDTGPVAINAAGNLTVVGNLVGGSLTSGAVYFRASASGCTLNVVGEVIAASAPAIASSGSVTGGTINIIGGVTASAEAQAVTMPSVVSVTVNGTFTLGSSGLFPVTAARLRVSASAPLAIPFATNGTPSTRTLYSIDNTAALNLPAVANVRAGTTYGDGTLTGTLAVPPPSAVASGVPTANTTGTAVLTQAAVVAALGTLLEG